MIPTWEVVLRNNEKKRRCEDDTNIEAGRERERERGVVHKGQGGDS